MPRSLKILLTLTSAAFLAAAVLYFSAGRSLLGSTALFGSTGFWGSKVSPPNVLVVLVDTLRGDHLGVNGYERNTSPFLDSFAKENLHLAYAVSPSTWTPTSVASLFTGLYPSGHRMMPPTGREVAKERSAKLDDSYTTLAELFKNAGYATAGITANPWVSAEFGFDQGFESFTVRNRVTARDINRMAVRYLQQTIQGDRPFFLYLHYMDPHFTYDPPGRFKTTFSGPLKWRAYPKPQEEMIGHYDGEILFTDTKLKELFDWLKQQGIYDSTVIVFLSDHGEQFAERGNQGHGWRVHSEENVVPFMIKSAPAAKIPPVPQHSKVSEESEFEAVKVTYPVSTVDAFPTLLDLAGIKLPHPVHGVSLASERPRRKATGVLSEIYRHHNQKAYIAPDGKKLILTYPLEVGYLIAESSIPASRQVYDTVSDYWELSPLADGELGDRLEREFRTLYGEALKSGTGYKSSEIPVDDKTLKELETLGYM